MRLPPLLVAVVAPLIGAIAETPDAELPDDFFEPSGFTFVPVPLPGSCMSEMGNTFSYSARCGAFMDAWRKVPGFQFRGEACFLPNGELFSAQRACEYAPSRGEAPPSPGESLLPGVSDPEAELAARVEALTVESSNTFGEDASTGRVICRNDAGLQLSYPQLCNRFISTVPGFHFRVQGGERKCFGAANTGDENDAADHWSYEQVCLREPANGAREF
jgi:hypothetical protein